MPSYFFPRIALAAFVLSVAALAQAQITDWDRAKSTYEAPEGSGIPVKEDDYEPPALASGVKWQEYYLNASTRNEYFVARDFISIGQDGAIRYVSRVVSSNGTENIAAEGIRCSTGERRVYATLNSRKEWVAVRGSRWLPIGGGNRLNSYAFALYSDYMCSAEVAVPPKKVLENLANSFTARTGTPLSGYR
ncbi:CNP1-like family protein [Methyloversatilis thermotolerans]|uniref:CNP1-like family protein n=1 Tax=Methyloversatilis thermotolerans TaxID=1346290 RepID=UPI0003A1AA37|nr:CNP1-like family protein [Methyloversatilis thermotolerans]